VVQYLQARTDRKSGAPKVTLILIPSLTNVRLGWAKPASLFRRRKQV